MTPPLPDGPKSKPSPGGSGESPGNCENKCCRSALLDVNIHATRTEAIVVSLNDLQVLNRATMRASKAALSTSDDVALLLRIAQYTGVCSAISGSCITAEKSRPPFSQAWKRSQRVALRSSAEG